MGIVRYTRVYSQCCMRACIGMQEFVWAGFKEVYTSHATLSIGLHIPRVTCIQGKYNWLRGYSMVCHTEALYKEAA